MQALDLNRVPALGPFGTVAIARFGCCMQPRRTWSVRGREAGTRALSDRNNKDQRDCKHGLRESFSNSMNTTCNMARAFGSRDSFSNSMNTQNMTTRNFCERTKLAHRQAASAASPLAWLTVERSGHTSGTIGSWRTRSELVVLGCNMLHCVAHIAT